MRRGAAPPSTTAPKELKAPRDSSSDANGCEARTARHAKIRAPDTSYSRTGAATRRPHPPRTRSGRPARAQSEQARATDGASPRSSFQSWSSPARGIAVLLQSGPHPARSGHAQVSASAPRAQRDRPKRSRSRRRRCRQARLRGARQSPACQPSALRNAAMRAVRRERPCRRIVSAAPQQSGEANPAKRVDQSAHPEIDTLDPCRLGNAGQRAVAIPVERRQRDLEAEVAERPHEGHHIALGAAHR